MIETKIEVSELYAGANKSQVDKEKMSNVNKADKEVNLENTETTYVHLDNNKVKAKEEKDSKDSKVCVSTVP